MKKDTWIDKSEWGEGPWQSECDRAEWIEEQSGYPCIVLRVAMHGAYCGYVGVPESHKYFGVEDKSDNYGDVDVHGGVTYAEHCAHHEEGRGVCHVGEEKRFWIGFDTMHGGDYGPAMAARLKKYEKEIPSYPKGFGVFRCEDKYRDFDYVRNEVVNLARQLKEMEK